MWFWWPCLISNWCEAEWSIVACFIYHHGSSETSQIKFKHISAPDLPVVWGSAYAAAADRRLGAVRITWSSALTKYGSCCSTFGIKNSLECFRSLFYSSSSPPPPQPCHIFVICSWESYQTLTCLFLMLLLYICTTQIWLEANKRDYCWSAGEIMEEVV